MHLKAPLKNCRKTQPNRNSFFVCVCVNCFGSSAHAFTGEGVSVSATALFWHCCVNILHRSFNCCAMHGKTGKTYMYVISLAHWVTRKNDARLIDVNPGQKLRAPKSEPSSGVHNVLRSRVQRNCVWAQLSLSPSRLQLLSHKTGCVKCRVCN